MKAKFVTLLIVVSVLAVLLLAAAPTVFAKVDVPKTRIVRLTIVNRTDTEIRVALRDRATDWLKYMLAVGPGQEKVFTVYTGDYYREVWACKLYTKTEVDLNFMTKWTIPVCQSRPVAFGEIGLEKLYFWRGYIYVHPHYDVIYPLATPTPEE